LSASGERRNLIERERKRKKIPRLSTLYFTYFYSLL